MDPILSQLSFAIGLHVMGVQNPQMMAEGALLRLTPDGVYACDAQPALVTASNSGIPAFLTTYMDPKVIAVLVAPMKAAEIVGSEVKKGDWLTETAMFQVVEATGATSSYGDYSENGNAGANVNFPQRQAYHYQVFTQWGEKELERMGLARLDWASQLNMASVLALNKFQNQSYFFGVSGLQNYGLLNSPALAAPITPTTKVAGGTSWVNATALEIYADIQKLYRQAQTVAKGLIDLETPMTLAMSPIAQVGMTKTNDFAVNVMALIKLNFPNMKIKTAPEYSTTSGELVQLIVDVVEGQRTADCAFTEKLRAHPIVVGSSNFRQKKSQGSFGCVIYRPLFITGMLGV